METQTPTVGSEKKDGICYRCMHGDHKHCYGHAPKTVCVCVVYNHQLEAAMISLRQNPELKPPPFPEEPGGIDRFYYLPHRACPACGDMRWVKNLVGQRVPCPACMEGE